MTDAVEEEKKELPAKTKQVRKQDIIPFTMTWKVLEACLKHYFEFKALYESEGTDEITLDNGVVLNYHDMLRGIDELPEKQKQAIWLICLEGQREEDAAAIMGYTKWSSPVGSLKRAGLLTLIEKYWNKDDE